MSGNAVGRGGTLSASNVLCGKAIACDDLGLRNIDRVMGFILPATTRTGEGYDRLSTMYEAMVQQRHKELAFVTKIVGGVEETRYPAGRGKAPFVPVNPQRQYEAVKFLIDRAFVEPKALLDPDVLGASPRPADSSRSSTTSRSPVTQAAQEEDQRAGLAGLVLAALAIGACTGLLGGAFRLTRRDRMRR